MKELGEALGALRYPGRGIVIGMHEKGSRAVVLYFITGRSEKSKNRIFVPFNTGIRVETYIEGDEDLKTGMTHEGEAQTAPPSKAVSEPARADANTNTNTGELTAGAFDPLRIYTPVKNVGANLIVTNGDQTETIYKEMIKRQATKSEELNFNQSVHIFDKAMRRRVYEDDAPHYTPRISGIAHISERKLSYALNVTKADTDAFSLLRTKNPSCLRFTYSYENPAPGLGHFIHTYMGDTDPLPSFKGEPECVILNGDIDDITDEAWSSLNEETRVALFVRFIELKGRKTSDRIINKNR